MLVELVVRIGNFDLNKSSFYYHEGLGWDGNHWESWQSLNDASIILSELGKHVFKKIKNKFKKSVVTSTQ